MEEHDNTVECGPERCVCEGGPSLGVLRDVQRAYEERMEIIHRTGGANKLQKQVEVLQSWVSDLVSQNTLLTRTVEELEAEITSRLLLERRRHSERDKSDNNKKLSDKVNEMKMLTESLKMENVTKEREIRRLNKDVHQYEQTIMALRRDLSSSKFHTPDVSKKDAEVMADICCSGRQECHDAEPVKEYGVVVRKETEVYQQPVQMEVSIKQSNENVLSLRQVNVALREEVHAMQRVCAALDEQCHVAALRAQFKDEIIHEMRQQLRKAKAKLKEVSESNSVNTQKERENETDRKTSGSFDSLTISCVQQQPRRRRRMRPEHDLTSAWEHRNHHHNASGDDACLRDELLSTLKFGMVTSTPNVSQEKMPLNESDLSVVEQPPSPPLLLTDTSINETDPEFPCPSHSLLQQSSRSLEIDRRKSTDETRNVSKNINKTIGEALESDDDNNNNSRSIVIVIEAMECDCDEDEADKEVRSVSMLHNTEASNGRTPNSNEAATTYKRKTRDSGQNSSIECGSHKPLAQITARRSSDSNKRSHGKKGVKRESTADSEKNRQNTRPLNVTETNTSPTHIESLGAHSAADSCASDSARARFLESKLLATTQILKNKEETMRVQAESLALAEARIAALTAKTQQASQKLHQAQQTPPYSTRSASADCHIDMTDVSSTADLQDMDHKIVDTLRDNLSVIEELYRECFYESVKQDELITMLRRSYLDMRLLEKQRSQQINRRQDVVHSQRCSLERCQEIALEVETLKLEITNFLNSSQNNDSGVWEREDYAVDATEDLRDIADQLRRLREMLNTDCTCGLEEENMKLKKTNESMEIQIGELRQRINDLEEALENKENMDQKYQAQIQEKERELQYLRIQLVTCEERSREQDNNCESLQSKLQQMDAVLKEKSSELLSARQRCEAQDATIAQLREELRKAEIAAQDSAQVRDEVSCLSAQVSQWRDQLTATRRRLRALEDELQSARAHCRHLATHYREKAQLSEELQSQLEEAQSRGAELCGEARRAVCGVRHWLRKQRQKNKEQEDKIKEQESIIQTLQQRLAPTPEGHITSDNEPCCSKTLTRCEVRRSERSFVSASETGCSKCAPTRLTLRTSESEVATSPTPPTPPRRLLRKKPFCGDIREMSPSDELLERVERAHEALADAHRRWARGAGGTDHHR